MFPLREKYLVFLILYIYFPCDCYVLRREVNGKSCRIDFSKSKLFVDIDKQLCNQDFSNINPFKFKFPPPSGNKRWPVTLFKCWR